MRRLRVKRIYPDAVLPARATPGSAGLDLCAYLASPLTLGPGETAVLSTGVAVEIPPGWCGFVFARSGLGIKQGIIPSNAVGVIDSDYRGELHVGLYNHSREPYVIEPGERIAQLLLMEVGLHEVVECGALSKTGRGAGGFGSTGK